MDARDTATELLDAAQALVQRRGFNAFSYKDLAQVVGIRTASIHYHFETKASLGKALMERYLASLEIKLVELDHEHPSQKARLEAFIQSYRDTESQGAICVCGSLASDLETLPEDLRNVVLAYLDRSQAWVEQTIREGALGGELAPCGSHSDLATTLVASLQGGLLLGRGHDGASALDAVERTFLTSIGCS